MVTPEIKTVNGNVVYGYDFIEKAPLVKLAGFPVTLGDSAKKNPRGQAAKPEHFFTKLWGEESVVEE